MKRKTIKSLRPLRLLCALCGSLFLMACEKMPDTEKTGITGVQVNSAGRQLPADAAPLAQQILRTMTAEPRTLDLSIDAYSASDLIHVFETLVIVSSDKSLKPGAAERWESNEEGTQWTFYIRAGNHWSDGQPVTAHDFEYAFKRLLDPKEASNYAGVYYAIKGAYDFNAGKNKDRDTVGIKAINDYTLVIETESPTPYLPHILGFVTAIPVPKRQVEKFGQKWTQETNSIASGPYMVGEWAQGQYLSFVPNPHYTGPNTGLLETIQYIFSNNPGAHFSAYENNEIDIHALSAIELTRIEKDEQLKKELVRSHAFTTWFLFFQTQTPPFNDVRVRQAIAHAIDREALCRTVMKGAAIPAYTMMPPGMPDHLKTDYSEYQAYNPELARQLLADAGYPNGRGFPKKALWLRQVDDLQQQVTQGIQAMLKNNLGIEIDLKNQESNVYFENMHRYEIPIGYNSFNQDYADPSNMISYVWRSQDVGIGRQDWKNPTFDRLVDQADGEMNPQTRRALYQEAQRVLSEDIGATFIYYQVNLNLAKPWLKNWIEGDTPGYPGYKLLSRVWDVYIGKEILEDK